MANVIEIVLRGTDQLSGPFRNALRSGQDFQRAMGIVGTAVAGALAALTISAIKTADEMGNMAERVTEPVDELSRLVHAAKLSDVEVGTLERGLKELGKSMVEAAAKPTSDAARAFELMGISVRDAEGAMRSKIAVLLEASDKFSNYREDVNKSTLALTLFGQKAGTELLPLLNKGSEAIRRMGEEASVVTPEMARDADEATRNWERMKTAIAEIGFTIAKVVLPPLIQFTFHLADNVRVASEAIEKNQLLAKWLNGVASMYHLAAAGAQAFAAVFSGTDWEVTMGRLQQIQSETFKKLEELFTTKSKPLSPTPPFPAGAGIESAPELASAEQKYADLLEAARTWAKEDLAITLNLIRAKAQAEQRGKDAIISTTGQMFGTMARLAATFGSKNFALQQAFQIGQAIMNTALGVTRAYAEHTFPYSAIVASIIAAMGAAEIAIIAGAKPGGQAHAGLDFVPREGTFLLDRGERVISRNQNADLDEFLDRQGQTMIQINLEGEPLWRGIGQASRDGRLTIDARAVA